MSDAPGKLPSLNGLKVFEVAARHLNFRLAAEELGVTQRSVEADRESSNPEIRRLLGTDGDFGKALGLDADWAVSILKAVGNYGESFERNLGQGSPLKIARGRNALWKDGGLMYAPPVR